MKRRTVMAATFAALSLSACVAYDADNPALYDDPALAARLAQDPFARDPFFADPVYVLRYDRFGRPFYVQVVPEGPPRFGAWGGGYWGGGFGRGPSGGRPRHNGRMTNENVPQGVVNGTPVDPNPNVRPECQGENCGVAPPRDQSGDQPRDPVIDVNPDVSVLEP